ncbi:hypothetical protein METSCH_D04510 [Metschnikowia aff. pulcherrima]|uniref:Uncharacterized protein n=1 Tax=Metschnikowia aff. pulcherrima TaxID=2163413 RepID=A0A4P6XTN5_9ASCO|nr:hypothetical protein METSCH_D04510 [Metschnikowia aff. pulcherrima]
MDVNPFMLAGFSLQFRAKSPGFIPLDFVSVSLPNNFKPYAGASVTPTREGISVYSDITCFSLHMAACGHASYCKPYLSVYCCQDKFSCPRSLRVMQAHHAAMASRPFCTASPPLAALIPPRVFGCEILQGNQAHVLCYNFSVVKTQSAFAQI